MQVDFKYEMRSWDARKLYLRTAWVGLLVMFVLGVWSVYA